MARAEAAMANSLDRFSAHLTRLEIHLSDENGDKNGQNDERSMREARIEGLQAHCGDVPGSGLGSGYRRATDKLKRPLDSTLDRLRGHGYSLKFGS